MRLSRLGFVLLAVYLVFVGGSTYYNAIFPVRMLHHLVVTVLLAVWMLRRWWSGQGLPATPVNLPLFALGGAWLVTAAAGIDPRVSFEALWFPLTFVVFFFAFAALIQRGRQRLLFETQFLLAALVVILSGMQLLSWYFGMGLTGDTQIGWVDVIGSDTWLPLKLPSLWLALGVTTWVSAYTAPLAGITYGWSTTTPRADYRAALRWLSIALLSVTLLTLSRGGALSLLAAGSTLLGLRSLRRLQQSERLSLSRATWLRIAAVSGVVILILGYIIIRSRDAGRVSGDALRRDLWSSAAEIFQDNPLVGVGPNLFGRAYREYRDVNLVDDRMSTAHNLYLNILAETGILGGLAGAWLLATFGYVWWRRWNRTDDVTTRRRLEFCLAALLGLAAQSIFDVFNITPIALLVTGLAAYCLVEPSTNPARVMGWRRYQPLLPLVLILAYGIAFVQFDHAQLHFRRSLHGSNDGLAEAGRASEIDPHLHLYRLNELYLSSQAALSQDPPALDAAITDYAQMVALEPTWDTGWINLAGLEARRGNVAEALYHLEIADDLNRHNPARLHWARLVEEQGELDRETIIAAYVNTLHYSPNLPLSDFWLATDLRREAVQAYAADQSAEVRYRIAVVYAPDNLAPLVPAEPQSADEWWVVGEYALTIEQDTGKAVNAFAEAISLNRTHGDYYVSLARAAVTTDAAAAERNLNLAELLGTTYEYPGAVRALLADTPQAIYEQRVNAVPPRVIDQNFEGVLFLGRVGQFELLAEMRWLGPGHAAMQPWYAIAAQYLADGDLDAAKNAYRAILDYAPDETEARRLLDELNSSPA